MQFLFYHTRLTKQPDMDRVKYLESIGLGSERIIGGLVWIGLLHRLCPNWEGGEVDGMKQSDPLANYKQHLTKTS